MSAMKDKIFNTVQPLLSYIDSGDFFRKPFSWLYMALAAMNVLAPFVVLYKTIDSGLLKYGGAKVIFSCFLIWIFVLVAGWVYAFVHVHAGLEWIAEHAPVPVAGMDFDNGGEFMNWSVIAWANQRNIPLTRARPYKHNDNAHIEQRNGDWIRRHAFRYRYETDAELVLLNELWDLVMARKDHLLPCVKAIGWATTRSGRKKRVYDKPRTPYQRLIDTGILNTTTSDRLQQEHANLNPAKVTRRINQIQRQLIDLASARTLGTRPAA